LCALRFIPIRGKTAKKLEKPSKKIKEQEENSEITVVYQDETHFQVTTSLMRK